MITERYVNRTNPRFVVKKIGQPKNEEDLDDNQLLERMQLGQGPESMTIHIDRAKTNDDILSTTLKKDDSKLVVEKPKVVLIETKITNQQLIKFFM